MRKTMWFVGSLALCLTLSLCFWPPNSSPTVAQEPLGVVPAAKEVAAPEPASTESSNLATKQRLAQRVQADFQDVALAQVLEYLADQLDIETFTQRQDLEAIGASLDMPVTLKLKRVRGDMLLDLILRQASPQIGYVVRDGIVIIAPKDALSEHLAIRVYNCRDLLSIGTPAAPAAGEGASYAPPGYPGAAPARAPYGPGMRSAPMPGASSYGGGGGGGIGGEMPAVARAPEVEQLMRLVQTTVAPDTWDTHGGPGTVEEFGGLFVVNQTEEVHDRIEKLLQMLREAAQEKGAKPGR